VNVPEMTQMAHRLPYGFFVSGVEKGQQSLISSSRVHRYTQVHNRFAHRIPSAREAAVTGSLVRRESRSGTQSINGEGNDFSLKNPATG
jgi:hypothetical protein